MRKRRWFFRIVTEADALKATDNGAKAIFLFATLYLFLMIFPYVFLSREYIWSENDLGLVTTLFFIFLGCSVQSKQSRTAAIAFVSWALLPISNIISLPPTVDIPKGLDLFILFIIISPNILLFFYATYYSILGSFKYQAAKQSRVVWRNTLDMAGIRIILSVVVIYAYLSIKIFLKIKSSTILLGGLPVILVIFVVWLVSWRILPGTRRLDAIARKRKLGFYRNYY